MVKIEEIRSILFGIGLGFTIGASVNYSIHKSAETEQTERTLSLEQRLIDDGFTSQDIYFDDLDVRLPRDSNRYFKEVYVKDLTQAKNDICQKYEFNYTPSVEGLLGFSVKFSSNSDITKGYANFIKEGMNDINSFFAKGHERGHFIWNLGEQEIIYQKFKDSALKSDVHDSEDFAILCGLFALAHKGYNVKSAKISSSSNPDMDLRFYRMSKIFDTFYSAAHEADAR